MATAVIAGDPVHGPRALVFPAVYTVECGVCDLGELSDHKAKKRDKIAR